MIDEFAELGAVLHCMCITGRGVNGTAQSKDIIGDNNAIWSKKPTLHNHVIVVHIVRLVSIDANDIEGSMKSLKTI